MLPLGPDFSEAVDTLMDKKTEEQDEFFKKYPIGTNIEYLSKQMKVCAHSCYVPARISDMYINSQYYPGADTGIWVKYFDKNDVLHKVKITMAELT